MSYATEEQLQELAAFMASKINVPTIGVGGGYAPIGTIIQYMGVTAPQDYLICDGTVYNIADYPQLADFFESQFGSKNKFGGNGSTTFAVPDLRGEFLRGTGTNSHANQGNGAAVGTHQDGTEHVGLYAYGGNNIGVNVKNTTSNTVNVRDRCIDYGTGRKGIVIADGGPYEVSSSVDYSTFTSRPTNTSVLFCIKAVVAGEVYSTEERVVGTWIDGKKLYQKTLFANSLTSQGTFGVQSGISNLYQLIDHSSVVWYDTEDKQWKSDHRYGPNFSIGMGGLVVTSTSVVLSNDSGSSNTIDWSARTNSVHVTIWYTKTTD